MRIPLRQTLAMAAYIAKQRLKRNKFYPLVLELEPLYQCNLECAGCGKIQHPTDILRKRLSVQQCIDAVEECGAPVVSIAGGEPLVHEEIGEIVEALIARKKFVYLCTNALLMRRKLDLFKPSPYFSWMVHIDGLRERHVRQGRRGDEGGQAARLPHRHQHHLLRSRRRNFYSGRARLSER